MAASSLRSRSSWTSGTAVRAWNWHTALHFVGSELTLTRDVESYGGGGVVVVVL